MFKDFNIKVTKGEMTTAFIVHIPIYKVTAVIIPRDKENNPEKA